MTTEPTMAPPRPPRLNRWRRLLRLGVEIMTSLLFLAAAIAVAVYYMGNRPHAQRGDSTIQPIPVQIVSAEPADATVLLQATGVVKPARESVLQADVSGSLIMLSKSLAPGEVVTKGEVLARIDNRDHSQDVTEIEANLAENQAEIMRNRAAVEQAKALVDQRRLELEQRTQEVEQAINDLRLEQAQGEAARQEFELLRGNTENANKALILREPQLKSAQAAVDSAKAAKASAGSAVTSAEAGVASAEASLASAESALNATQSKLKTAKLNLERTTITAPFDALVLTRPVAEGAYVSPSTTIATLAAIDEYWVEVSLPMDDLARVRLPDGDHTGSNVEIHCQGWGDGVIRHGEVLRSLGTVEEEGQMARLLVRVADPLSRRSESPKLLLNAFAQTVIRGEDLKDVYAVPSDAVREGNQLLLAAADNKLDMRSVHIAWSDHSHAYVSSGLSRGERVIVSAISVPKTGLPLKVEDAPAADERAEP